MPVIQVPYSIPSGGRIRVEVWIGEADLLRRRKGGLAILAPMAVDAVIDTGAERTCVDPRVVTRLGLPPCASGLMVAPGVTGGAAALGGAFLQYSYEGALTVLHPSNKAAANLVLPTLVMEEVPLAGFGVDVVIGRDVLALCVLVLDGPAGAVTLAY